MTNLFVVGEPIPDTYKAADLPADEGLAFSGPGGFEVVLKIDGPSRSQIRAVESDPIGLGVRDGGESETAFLLQIGLLGERECIEAEVKGPAVSGSDWARMWWGEDVELGLVDSEGVCRAVRQFAGPGEGMDEGYATNARESDQASRPCVATFPNDRYGLIQPQGPMTVDTIIEYGLALIGLPDWTPGFTEVLDLRRATEIRVEPFRIGELYRLESQTREALRGSRTILVLPESWRPAVASAAPFYGRVAGSVGRSINVCKTVEGALSKLRVEQIPQLSPCGPSL